MKNKNQQLTKCIVNGGFMLEFKALTFNKPSAKLKV